MYHLAPAPDPGPGPGPGPGSRPSPAAPAPPPAQAPDPGPPAPDPSPGPGSRIPDPGLGPGNPAPDLLEFINYDFEWALNIGMPASNIDDEEKKSLYEVISEEAWRLSLGNELINYNLQELEQLNKTSNTHFSP